MQPALLASELTNSFTFLSLRMYAKEAASKFHVPIRLFLRIGTPSIFFRESEHPCCAVYTRLSSPV